MTPAIAGDLGCSEITNAILGKTFVAKKPLYDTVIGPNGILDLERDNEEIPAGATCRVKDVDCGRSKIEVKLKQVTREKEFNKVEIEFKISNVERNAQDGIDRFQKMLAYVLEETKS